MTLQAEHTVRLFDRFCIVIPANLKYHQDGLPGKRVLLIANEQESFTASFEEGMQMMDMLPMNNSGPSSVMSMSTSTAKRKTENASTILTGSQ